MQPSGVFWLHRVNSCYSLLMSNTNRPEDTRCPDHDGVRGLGCRTGDKVPAVCAFCDLGTCNGDGAPMTPEQVAESRRECPTADQREVYCPTCLAEIKGDTGGVPVEVPEEESGAQTVRAVYEPIGRAGLGEVRAERKAACL